MFYLYWLLVALVLVAGLYALYRRFVQKKPVNASQVKTATRQAVPFMKPSKSASNLRAWVVDHAGKKPLGSWFANLPDSEVKVIQKHLEQFAADNGFELAWVLDGTLEADSALSAEVQKTLLAQIETYHVLNKADEKVETFALYQSLVENPRQHLDVLQNLYAILVERGLSEPLSPDMVMAPSKERRQHTLQVIQKAAEADWSKFAEALSAAKAQKAEAEAQSPSLAQRILPTRNKGQGADDTSDTAKAEDTSEADITEADTAQVKAQTATSTA